MATVCTTLWGHTIVSRLLVYFLSFFANQQITLLYFASLRTALPPNSPSSALISLPSTPSPLTLSDLRKHLLEVVHLDNEEFKLALGKSEWSVDEVMYGREEEGSVVLVGGETVVGIPPVSGG